MIDLLVDRAVASTSHDDGVHCGARSQCIFRYACPLYGETRVPSNVGIWAGRCIRAFPGVHPPPQGRKIHACPTTLRSMGECLPGARPARYLCVKYLISSPTFILTLGSPPGRPQTFPARHHA